MYSNLNLVDIIKIYKHYREGEKREFLKKNSAI